MHNKDTIAAKKPAVHAAQTSMQLDIGACLNRLIAYPSTRKYFLMAHHQSHYRAYIRLMGCLHDKPLNSLVPCYLRAIFKSVSKPENTKNLSQAMMHMLGYLTGKLLLIAPERVIKIIHHCIKSLVLARLPLILLKHHLPQQDWPYSKNKGGLEPYLEKISRFAKNWQIQTIKAALP